MVTAFKKNKFTQTLATGAATVAVIAGVGVVSAPAQAYQLGTAGLQWEGEADAFFNEVGQQTFDIVFTKIDDYDGTEALDAVTPPNPFSTPHSISVTGNFNLFSQIGQVYTYKLLNDLTFDFDNPTGTPVTGASLTWTAPTDTEFVFVKTNTQVQGILGTSDLPYLTYDGQVQEGPQYTLIASTFTLSNIDTQATGGFEAEYDQEATVPEPSSVLGLLALGGLGLGLKRKKQG